jgi:hypothetical protein
MDISNGGAGICNAGAGFETTDFRQFHFNSGIFRLDKYTGEIDSLWRSGYF